jgi:hypothetical protein
MLVEDEGAGRAPGLAVGMAPAVEVAIHPLALCGLKRGGTGILGTSPRHFGGWARGPASAGPLLCYQVAGFVIAPWASLSFSGNWLAARTPQRICLAKLGRVRCRARLTFRCGFTIPTR